MENFAFKATKILYSIKFASNLFEMCLNRISPFNQNLTSFEIVIAVEVVKPKDIHTNNNKNHVLTRGYARYTAYTHLYQTYTHPHTKCAHKTHMWLNNNSNTIKRIEFVAAGRDRICVHVSCISTRNSWHEIRFSTHQRCDMPSAREEIIWLVNAERAHAHTHTHLVATVSHIW